MYQDYEDNRMSFREEFEQEFDESGYSYKFNNHVLAVTADDLHSTLLRLRDDWNFVMLLDICGVDNLKRPREDWIHDKRFICTYHLLNMVDHQRLRVCVPLDLSKSLPSVKDLWKAADWFEREVWDMFGIKFERKNLKRLLTHEDFVGHPLRKDYSHNQEQRLSSPAEMSFDEEDVVGDDVSEEALSEVVIGPNGPLARGTVRVLLKLDAEIVRGAKLEIGHLHRCFEKICEGIHYNQVIPYTDRLNYCSAAINNIGWCKAVEDLMQIEIPDRAKAMRMVVAELSRIVDHLLCIGNMAEDAGALSNYWFCFGPRENIYDLFERICGARITVSLTRIGGMNYDFPPGWINDCMDMLKVIEKSVEELQNTLTRNAIWLRRTGVCPVSAKNAIEWGYTGPCLRASGVNYDIRKVSPYYFYEDVDFEIPLGINGDCYDRYLVRVEEIRQSLKIILQVLSNFPGGPVMVENQADKMVALPDKKERHKNVNFRRDHTNLIAQGICPPGGEIYSATEAANGELGFYVISDGGPCPYRVKVRPPCYAIFQSFPEAINGEELQDAAMMLSSMNVVAGELDR